MRKVWIVALGFGVLLPAGAVAAKVGEAEARESYPTGHVAHDAMLSAGERHDVAVTPKLTVSFTAGPVGAHLNVSIDVKWLPGSLPQPVAAAPGAVLSYIQVDDAGLEGIASVRFDCAVDPGFSHDLLYWDGLGWSPLMSREGERVEGRSGARAIEVRDAAEADGRIVVEVDHASSFALTSSTVPAEDEDRPVSAVGVALLLAGLATAAILRRR